MITAAPAFVLSLIVAASIAVAGIVIAPAPPAFALEPRLGATVNLSSAQVRSGFGIRARTRAQVRTRTRVRARVVG